MSDDKHEQQGVDDKRTEKADNNFPGFQHITGRGPRGQKIGIAFFVPAQKAQNRNAGGNADTAPEYYGEL